jgi:hypothetical protein
MGEFSPITNRNEFLQAIRSHYERMRENLKRAPALFGEVDQAKLGPTTWAMTLTDDRIPGEPSNVELACGMYFGSLFANSTVEKQTEVVVHELAHFKEGHNFGDPIKPDSEAWGKFDGAIGILNAWSYSMFMLEVVFGRSTPFPR